jgi:hypothetical protein
MLVSRRNRGNLQMNLHSTVFRTIIFIGLAGGVAIACTEPSANTGSDRKTRSETSNVTWTDGKPAYAISCEDPGGCQARAMALCSGANYTTLKSENMPTVGTARAALGKPSVVVRCGA